MQTYTRSAVTKRTLVEVGLVVLAVCLIGRSIIGVVHADVPQAASFDFGSDSWVDDVLDFFGINWSAVDTSGCCPTTGVAPDGSEGTGPGSGPGTGPSGDAPGVTGDT